MSLLKSILPILSILFFASMAGCKTASVDENQPGKVVDIFCENSQTIRVHYKKDTGSILQKGPVALPSGASCSDAEGFNDKQMLQLKEEGQWIQYYSSGGKLGEGQYSAGKKEGMWTFYSQEGQLIREVMYQNDFQNGQDTFYFPGTRDWRARGQNSNGKKTGTWEERLAANSDCISTGRYVEDNKQGEWTECMKSQDGDIYKGFVGEYRKGLKDGPAAFYHPTGEPMATGDYRADLTCLQNPPDGDKTKCEKRIGTWKIYHDNGKLFSEGSYNPTTGKRNGTWTEYYESGQKMAMGQRVHARQGMWTFWDKSGNIIFQFRFEGNDFSPKYAVLYENGRKSAEGPLSMGLVKYEQSEDRIHTSAIFKNGPWKLYGPGGQVVGEGTFVQNKKHGPWKEMVNGRMQTVQYQLGLKR
ncbi:MAG: hypothetical protein RH862_19700 [Leptospiraceae bacterium]